MKVHRPRGFTLLEIMIVLVIIGGIAAILVPTLFSKNDREVRAEIRQFSLMSKEIRNKALIQNSTYRIVFKINTKDKTSAYRVEASPGKILIDDPEERLKFIQERLSYDEDKEKNYQKLNPFKVVKKFSPEGGKAFPGDLYIKKMQLQGINEDFTEGEVAIHFFPEGLVELALLQVTNQEESLKWTLATSPLTGAIDVFSGHLELEDFEDQSP